MRIEIDKEEYKDLIETKEEFLKTVRKLDNITIENIKLTDKLQEKEQECEELKEDRERWKSNFNGKVSAIEELLQQLDQLKQILVKIKGICNDNDELQGDFNLVDCDKYKLGKHNLANKILQKISECEVENES